MTLTMVNNDVVRVNIYLPVPVDNVDEVMLLTKSTTRQGTNLLLLRLTGGRTRNKENRFVTSQLK